MIALILVAFPFALGFILKNEGVETTTTSVIGCEPLPLFQQDTPTTKAGIARFSPPMEQGLLKTNFSCDPLSDHNMTMVTSFSSFFGGTPFQYVSPANDRWEIELKCNTEQHYWYHEELVEGDILYHIKFYKIRCNSFLFTDLRQMDIITEELKGVPFP